MEELEELQRKLSEVQTTNTSQSLSERNIVDIIDKLKKKKKLKIFFSSDGREFVTPSKVENEIYELLMVHKRISLVDLPGLVNVPQEKALKCAKLLAQRRPSQKYDFKVFFFKEAIFIEAYLDEILATLKDDLQKNGIIELGTFAALANLSLDFLMENIKKTFGSADFTFLGQEKILTKDFYKATEAKIRGALRGCYRPVELSRLVVHHDIKFADTHSIVQSLIANEEVDGKVSNGVFSPTLFLRNQEMIIKKFFAQNEYVEYQFIEKNLFVLKPVEYLKNLFKSSALLLETCCFNAASLATKKDNITSVLEEEGYVGLFDHLPTILTDKDLDTIVWKYWEITGEIFEGNFIITHKFVEKCSEAFRDSIADWILKSPYKLIEKNETDASQAKGKRKYSSHNKSTTVKKQQLFSNEEVIKHLKAKEILKDDEGEFEVVLASLVQERMEALFEDVMVRLFESKKVGAIAVNNEIMTRIQDLTVIIFLGERSLRYLDDLEVGGNTNSLIENLMTSASCLIEHLIVFICQKQNIGLANNIFLQAKETKGSKSPATTGLYNKIFKNYAHATNTIDLLPPSFSAILKEMKNCLSRRDLEGFLSKGIEKIPEALNFSVELDRKAQKNFLSLVRNSAKDSLKSESEPKNIFYKILIILLSELGLLYVFTEEEEKIIIILAKMVLDISKDADVKNVLQHALSCYQQKRSLKALDKETLLEFIKKMRIQF